MKLTVLPEPLAVCRLPAGSPAPPWLDRAGGGFSSVTRTPDETSIVCDAGAVPAGVRCQQPWRALKVAGPLDFGQIGILAELSALLAAAGISVFALSTFDTDYLLVGEADVGRAADALRQAGHLVVD